MFKNWFFRIISTQLKMPNTYTTQILTLPYLIPLREICQKSKIKPLTISKRSPKLLLCFWLPTVSNSYLQVNREKQENYYQTPTHKSVNAFNEEYFYALAFSAPHFVLAHEMKNVPSTVKVIYLFVWLSILKQRSRHDKVISC